MTLRERIKMLCKQRGTSLNKVETECGFAKGYLSKLDKSTPNMAYLQKIAECFGVTTDYLLTGEEKQSEFSPEQAELDLKISQDMELKEALKKYFSLSDTKKKHIIEMIELLSKED